MRQHAAAVLHVMFEARVARGVSCALLVPFLSKMLHVCIAFMCVSVPNCVTVLVALAQDDEDVVVGAAVEHLDVLLVTGFGTDPLTRSSDLPPLFSHLYALFGKCLSAKHDWRRQVRQAACAAAYWP